MLPISRSIVQMWNLLRKPLAIIIAILFVVVWLILQVAKLAIIIWLLPEVIYFTYKGYYVEDLDSPMKAFLVQLWEELKRLY